MPLDFLQKIKDFTEIASFRHKWNEITVQERSWIKTFIKEQYQRNRVWEQEKSISKQARYIHGHRRAAFGLLIEIIDALENKNDI